MHILSKYQYTLACVKALSLHMPTFYNYHLCFFSGWHNRYDIDFSTSSVNYYSFTVHLKWNEAVSQVYISKVICLIKSFKGCCSTLGF